MGEGATRRRVRGGVRDGAVLAGGALVVCGLVVVFVQLRRGGAGIGLLRGESVETRRAVRRAIRDGETDDARVDQLTRRALEVTSRPRWGRYLFTTMLVLSIFLLAVGSHTVTDIVVRASQVLLWSGLIVLNVVNQHRFDNYRGLRPNRTGADTTTASEPSSPT